MAAPRPQLALPAQTPLKIAPKVDHAAEAYFEAKVKPLLDHPLVNDRVHGLRTPVLAWNCGSVPEIIDEGVTGFILDSESQALRAIDRAAGLDRKLIRNVFERRFTARAMAEAYVKVYEQLERRSSPMQRELVRVIS